ncbi:sensor histidine kinase [Stakelama marina]|uniref:histidine kinase n=1 Tax=Stakelama marina TaxID=2826939 RepID=A0A8T4IH33_9SPHN|nr:histidine kinase dimerization/phosphoacceptor domain -containing protein [Stakelama marina]MBR0553194.1 ATP-binding protein [Stakelama marina]
MARLGELDVPDRLSPFAPVWMSQIGFAVMCAAAAYVVRMLVDTVAPSSGPFSLGYAAVLVATLFGRWQSGLLTAGITSFYAWYFALPVHGSFVFADPTDRPRAVVNTLAYLLVILLAERFRVATRHAVEERDRQIEERDLFLAEFDHRVKNNFAVVTSMLDMQRRRARDGATADALGSALNRVESIARAHRHLYRGHSAPGSVQIDKYLGDLCDALREALLLHGAVQLRCETDAAAMSRDEAVSIGLLVNELVTNAAKHAFAGRERGEIRVAFRTIDGGYVLEVADDGVGLPKEMPQPTSDGGLGQRLIDAFARQAGGTLATDSGPNGTTVTLTVAG